MSLQQYLILAIISLVAAALVGGLVWYWLRAVWFSEANQKDRLAQRLARKLARNVLHHTFYFSYVSRDKNGDPVISYAKFLQPYTEGVRLAADNPDLYVNRNNHPDSYLKVWNWAIDEVSYVPIASVTLELDTNRLPFDTSLDTLLKRRDEIEEHAILVLREYGVVDVLLEHYKLTDRRHHQVRLLFRLIFRQREKGPIPQRVDYGDVVDFWGEFEFGRRKKREDKTLEREKLAARLLDYGIKHFGGTFPLKNLQALFKDEISHRQIEALGQHLEAAGILQKVGGPNPRRIIVDKALEFIERLLGADSSNNRPLLPPISDDGLPDFSP